MNSSIVIALPNMEDAKTIRSLLVRRGLEVTGLSTSGAGALAAMSGLDGGVLICGYRLQDFYYRDLLELLPADFEMVLLASERVIMQAPASLLCLTFPIVPADLASTVELVLQKLERRWKKRAGPRQRTQQERDCIRKAKQLLMERNHLTEEEAHRYLQKCSMDTGTDLAESAQMVLMML